MRDHFENILVGIDGVEPPQHVGGLANEQPHIAPFEGNLREVEQCPAGRQPGETMPVKVLRDGERLDLQLPLRAMRPEEDRVPPYVFGRGPDYLVVGGLVFEELTRPYLGAWGDWARRNPAEFAVSVRELGTWFSQRQLRPHLSATFPLARAAEALQLMADRQVKGKVVITSGA